MKPIGIVTDSHGGISQADAEKLGVKILPMPLMIGEESFLENVSITREEFFARLNNGEKPATSQPSPEQVVDIWREALKEYESILHMPISSGLSGSCNTARMLAQEDEFEGKVFVVDNGRISTPMHRSILDAVELIGKGYKAKQIKDILELSKNEMSIYIAVETLEHLKNGGRISATTAAWVEEIKTYFPGMDVLCDDLSLGISCHTGEGALGIGCSVKPQV